MTVSEANELCSRDPTPGVLDQVVETLSLSTRSLNCLKRGKVFTLRQLCLLSPDDLSKFRNMGALSVREITNALASRGLTLAGPKNINPTIATDHESSPDFKQYPDARTLIGWLDIVCDGLPERSRAIITSRHGLDGQVPPTYDEMGAKLGLTRERIRQILAKAMDYIGRVAPRRLPRLSGHYASLIRSVGGVTNVENLSISISHLYSHRDVDPTAFTRFVLPHCKDVVSWGGEVWATPETSHVQYRAVVESLEEMLTQAGMPLDTVVLLEQVVKQFPELDIVFLEACLKTSSSFLNTAGGWTTLQSWGRGIKGRWILAVLRQMDRPAHFTEIAAYARTNVPELEGMTDHNVHAILSRLNQQVERTDAGTFGLKNWGIEGDRYIAGFLEEALERVGGPANIEQLKEYVSQRKSCSEQSVRAYLETDRRFMRLGRNIYTLARWVVPQGDEGQLAQLRSIPLQPDWIVSVVELLVEEEQLSEGRLREVLANMRQRGRSGDYISYLVSRMWAVQDDTQGALLPTERAHDLYSICKEERVFQFAMGDANFQAYLYLLFVEFLVRLNRSGESERLARYLDGPLAPLRPIYSLMTSRLDERCYRPASTEEEERHLLQVIRAPGIPQVFVRWAEPATGKNSSDIQGLLNRVIDNQRAFPSLPSRVFLRLIPQPDARLLALTVALAAEADGAVNFLRLEEFAIRQGRRSAALSGLVGSLLISGLFVDERNPAQVRLLSPHVVVADASDLSLVPGLDLADFRNILWDEGVLIACRNSAAVPPDVRVELTPIENVQVVTTWQTLSNNHNGVATRLVPDELSREEALFRNVHLTVLHQLLIMAHLGDPILIRPDRTGLVVQYGAAELGKLGAILDELLRTFGVKVRSGGLAVEDYGDSLAGWLISVGIAEQVYGHLQLSAPYLERLYEPPLVNLYLFGGEGHRSRIKRSLNHLTTEVVDS